MTDRNIPVILGTGRVGRRSEAVAELVIADLKDRGVVTHLIDVAHYSLTATATPGAGTSVDVYQEIIAAADGLIIVAPEYNHGYPGELKLLLDADCGGYWMKPVGVVSVSSGLGGVRMFEQLIPVLTALRMVVTPGVHVPEVEDALGADGSFAAEGLQLAFTSMVDEVLRLAPELREVRRRLEP